MKFAIINKKTNNIDFFHKDLIDSNSYFSVELDEEYDYRYDYIFDGEKIIKNIKVEFDFEKNEKQKLFSEYKSNLENIKNINLEIQEIEQTSEYFPELALKRINKLGNERTDFRTKNGEIISQAVEIFGEEIINEF